MPLSFDLEEAIKKYNEKLEYTTLKTKLAAIQVIMQRNTKNKQPKLQTLQLKVNQVLSKSGVPIAQNFYYQTYAEQLHVVVQKYHPSVCQWAVDWFRELKIVAERWKAKGLDRDVMLEIAIQSGAKDIERYL